MAYTPFSFTKITEFIDRMASDSRKIEVRNLINMYNDDWRDQLEDELSRQFSEKVRDKLYHLMTTEYNLLKRVTDEISLVYKEPATRKAYIPMKQDGDELSMTEDPVYADVIAKSNINTVMKTVNHYVTFLNQVVVRPVVRNGVMEFDMFTLDAMDIVTDPQDWKRIVAVKYYVGMELPSKDDVGYSEDAARGKAWTGVRKPMDGKSSIATSQYNQCFLWTLEDYESNEYDESGAAHSTFFKSGKLYTMKRVNGQDVLADEGVDIQYKDARGSLVLPFVIFWKKYPVNSLIDHTSGTDLRDATIRLGVNISHYQYLMKFQSYKVGQISTRDKSKLQAQLTLDPGYLYINEDSEGTARGLEVVDFTADLTQIWTTIEKGVTMFLSNYFISPANFTLSGSAQSGYAMEISNSAKLDFRKDQIEIYREREKALFDMTRIVWNTDGVNADGFKPIRMDAEFSIDFAEITFPKSPSELADEFTFLKLQNVVTPIDLIMARNPDLTREQAEERYRMNKAFNASQNVSLAAPMSPLIAPQQPEGVEEEEDEEGTEDEA